METYRTVDDRGRSEFQVQGSGFLGHVRPVDAVGAAESFVASVREEYPDATHHVPAYRVRAGELTREYQSDDGEPTGSSGKPALNVLQQRDLLNVAAVVVRYYGGTNLGVGGLARAYSRAVKAAVDDAGVVEERPHERLRVAVDYDDSGTVRGILESEGVSFEADYGERATFEVRVPVAASDDLRDRLRSATSGRVEVADGE
jgi:uncharacterized YigZ family protein